MPALLLVQIRRAQHELVHAEKDMQWSAQLVTDAGEELRLGPARRERRVARGGELGVAQFGFGSGPAQARY